MSMPKTLSESMVNILWAFDKHVRILFADFLKEIPMPLTTLIFRELNY